LKVGEFNKLYKIYNKNITYRWQHTSYEYVAGFNYDKNGVFDKVRYL